MNSLYFDGRRHPRYNCQYLYEGWCAWIITWEWRMHI